MAREADFVLERLLQSVLWSACLSIVRIISAWITAKKYLIGSGSAGALIAVRRAHSPQHHVTLPPVHAGRVQRQHSTAIDFFWLSESDKASIAEQEADFSANYGHLGYGYSNKFQTLRSEHFPQLSGGVVYLDHAAATLYSAEQLLSANAELSKHLFANPHTQLGAELDSTATAIEQLRQMTLSMLNASADEYEVSDGALGPRKHWDMSPLHQLIDLAQHVWVCHEEIMQ